MERESIDYRRRRHTRPPRRSAALLGLSARQPARLDRTRWCWGCSRLRPSRSALFVVVERRAERPAPAAALLHASGTSPRRSSPSVMSNFALHGRFHRHAAADGERIFGFTVAATSLAMICRPLSFSVSSPVAGYVAVRVGERRASVFGYALRRGLDGLLRARCGDRVAGARVRRPRALRARPGDIATVADHLGRQRGGDGEPRRGQCGAGDGHPRSASCPASRWCRLIQGGAASPAFTSAYLAGGIVAVVGIVGAAFVHRPTAGAPQRGPVRVAARSRYSVAAWIASCSSGCRRPAATP